MTQIPRAALLLGLAGLLPFGWGVMTMWMPQVGQWAALNIGPRFVGPYVSLSYGTVILAFMSGVLWGFATRAEGRAASACYALSVLPALWAFFMVGNGPVAAATSLAIGFIALLVLDWQFWSLGLAPKWWLQLRSLLTAGVLLCLAPVIFG